MDATGKFARSGDRLAPVVDLIYDAALEEDRWQGVATAIAEAFDAPSAVLKTCDGPYGPQLTSVTENLRPAPSEQAWADHWHRHDLWIERSANFGLCSVFTSQGLMPDAEFERTGFYQDWTRRLDIRHMVGVLFPIGGGEKGVLGVHRPKASDCFGDSECRQLEALLPHVRRALSLRDRLRESALARNAAFGALECIETGVLVVDSRCSLLFANSAAERLLRSSREIRVLDNRLCIDDARSNGRLGQVVREAARTAAGELRPPDAAFAVGRAGRLPLTLMVSPWRANWAPTDLARPAAMIFLRDAEDTGLMAERTLREIFGLTPSEAAVAAAIGAGQSLEQIAGSMGVRLGTVRSHLKKVLAKTGTSRQGPLATLVARSVAGIATPGSKP